MKYFACLLIVIGVPAILSEISDHRYAHSDTEAYERDFPVTHRALIGRKKYPASYSKATYSRPVQKKDPLCKGNCAPSKAVYRAAGAPLYGRPESVSACKGKDCYRHLLKKKYSPTYSKATYIQPYPKKAAPCKEKKCAASNPIYRPASIPLYKSKETELCKGKACRRILMKKVYPANYTKGTYLRPAPKKVPCKGSKCSPSKVVYRPLPVRLPQAKGKGKIVPTSHKAFVASCQRKACHRSLVLKKGKMRAPMYNKKSYAPVRKAPLAYSKVPPQKSSTPIVRSPLCKGKGCRRLWLLKKHKVPTYSKNVAPRPAVASSKHVYTQPRPVYHKPVNSGRYSRY